MKIEQKFSRLVVAVVLIGPTIAKDQTRLRRRAMMGESASNHTRHLQSIGTGPPRLDGSYTIQQVINNNYRYLDAYQGSNDDYDVVTRPVQDNDTQLWDIKLVGNVYTIQQKSTGRHLDAHRTQSHKYSAVTRIDQSGHSIQKWTQMWLARLHERTGESFPLYRLQQLTNGRYLDNYAGENDGYDVRTRPFEEGWTQGWTFEPSCDHTCYEICNYIDVSGGNNREFDQRCLDAYERPHKGNADDDYNAFTNPLLDIDSQQWEFNHVAKVYTIRQHSNGRYLDAYEHGNGYSAVTREFQRNDSQKWVLTHSYGDTYEMQQLSTLRYAQGDDDDSNDYSVVARPGARSNDDLRRWIIREG